MSAMMRSTSIRQQYSGLDRQPHNLPPHRTYTMAKRKKPEAAPDVLKGWRQIATFLGQPVSVVQRWASEGMPARRQGRYVQASREELNHWLGRESAGEPVQIATPETDLNAALKRGLKFVRKQHAKASGGHKAA
jgi:hypothetical protein